MDLDRLISGLEIRRVAHGQPSGAVRICDITEDSRTVMPGSLFIARRGEKVDGRAFVRNAIAAGAVAVLTDDEKLAGGSASPAALGVEALLTRDIAWATAALAERFYGSPSSKLAIAGVTGTNGKTTVAFLVHQILNGAAKENAAGEAVKTMRCGLMGTVCIDDGTEVAPASLTTAPALEISRTLARMLESGCSAAVLEASSHALHQRRVGAIRFKVGVFTNLTHDHLDYHGTMDEYADAKRILFENLQAEGTAIINVDDPAGEKMAAACPARVWRCSMHGYADWTAKIVDEASSGGWTACEIVGPGGIKWKVKLPLVGAHNVMNALEAAATAVALGMSPADVAAGLERVKAPPGRLEPITGPDDALAVFVDYAHTDDALQRVASVLADVARRGGGRLHIVFGCGGDRDRTKRPKMGAIAASLADRVIVTSDNPRTEEPLAIIDQIVAGVPGAQRQKVSVEADRQRAIVEAIASAKAGDVVLIAGKGHEDYQILPDGLGGTIKRHFDDREEGRRALAARGIVTGAAGALASAGGAKPKGKSGRGQSGGSGA